jgi:hypothetical protein
MLEYESLRELFLLFKVKNTLLKHWSDSNVWPIAKAMHDVVFFKTLFMISKLIFVDVNSNEVTIVDA